MGQVWSAVHVVTGRRVAIKRLLLAAEDGDEHRDSQARARFVLEAQTACAVEHTNVVQVLDFIEPGDEPPLLVMELLEGETLAAKLDREHALSLEETANVLLPVVSAVGTAHSLGIIHRDLKPANIFLQQHVGSDRVVKVLDFGIAKWVAQQPTGTGLRTQTGSTLGTPCYMAPEQAIGERLIDHTSDIWSLGIILYECLSGGRPVDGENAVQMVMRLMETGIMPIERVVPTLPSDVARLIGQMLSRDARRRPQDLREIFDVLRKYSEVSARAFGAPSLAIDSERFASGSKQSVSVDANAATLRDDSNPPSLAPSWEGQSVSSQAAWRMTQPKKRLATLVGIPALIALSGYALVRNFASTNEHAQVSPPPVIANVAPASPTPTAPPVSVEAAPPKGTTEPAASAEPVAVRATHSAPRAASTPKPHGPRAPAEQDGTGDRK